MSIKLTPLNLQPNISEGKILSMMLPGMAWSNDAAGQVSMSDQEVPITLPQPLPASHPTMHDNA